MVSQGFGINSLNVELLTAIFEYVDDTSPLTTRSLGLVNKSFYDITTLVIHRCTILQCDSPGGKALRDTLQEFMKNEKLLRGCRHLTVNSPQFDGLVLRKKFASWGAPLKTQLCLVDEDVSALVDFIKRLANLRAITWKTARQMPLQVLETLHAYHPKAKLMMPNYTRVDDTHDHTDPTETALSHSPALTFIKSMIWSRDSFVDLDVQEAAFQRIVASAPNLRHASIIRKYPSYFQSDESRSERKENEHRLAKFHTHRSPSSSLRSLTLDGYQMNSETISLWSKFVDLSQLEFIKCSRGLPDISFFKDAPRIFKNLKSLSLNLLAIEPGHLDMHAAILSYLENCPVLEAVSLWSWRGVIPLSSLIYRHGISLKSLELHERENIVTERLILSLGEVRMIRENFPNLKYLSIDLDRQTRCLNVNDNKDMFEELSMFDLDRLQVYYDLGLHAIANHIQRNQAAPGDFDIDEFSDSDDDDDDDDDDDYDDEEEGAQNESKNKNTNTLADSDSNEIQLEQDKNKEPARKRRKTRAEMKPSTYLDIERFVQEMWKVIFGHKTTGLRALDVKFGEWERKLSSEYTPQRFMFMQEIRMRTFWQVRPQERDDRQGECWVRAHGDNGAFEKWKGQRTSMDSPSEICCR